MSKLVVAKYGGTSMAQPEVVAQLIAQHPEQKVIVCSAPGTSADNSTKVTDMLIALADGGQLELIDDICARFSQSSPKLLEDLRRDLRSGGSRAFIISRGEYYSARDLAERISGQFVDTKDLFFFDSRGELDRQKTLETIKTTINSDVLVIVPGFYGSDPTGNICLFGRGGSDRTGAVLASALPDHDYHNWTDVDGVFSADPRIVDNAHLIEALTYEEVREGAHGGSGVLMGDTILDLDYALDCETRLRNTFNPNAPGTSITKTRAVDDSQPVVAISGQDDLLALQINDLGMRDQPGYVAHILEVIAKAGISIEHMPAAQDAITFTFHKSDVSESALAEVVQQVQAHFVSPSAECKTLDCGVVYLVGEGLRRPEPQHSVTIKALQELDGHGIAALTVIMNPSSPSVAVLVPSATAHEAIKLLHAAFFG